MLITNSALELAVREVVDEFHFLWCDEKGIEDTSQKDYFCEELIEAIRKASEK